jgi:hypothetical protein
MHKSDDKRCDARHSLPAAAEVLESTIIGLQNIQAPEFFAAFQMAGGV